MNFLSFTYCFLQKLVVECRESNSTFKEEITLNNTFKPESKNIKKFIIMSIIGVFLFMALMPWDDTHNIPLGIAIDLLNTRVFSLFTVPGVEPAGRSMHFQHVLAFVAINVSMLGTILAYTLKPSFIENNPKVRSVFRPGLLYVVTRVVATIIVWMLFLNVGPAAVIASHTGDEMIHLAAALITIFIFLVPAMPLLTDFGLMEFIGIYIKKLIRALFTLPGRSSVDLMASWFGSSVAAVLITRGQHERGFYTGREAAVVAVNFSFVSVPFTFVVVSFIDITHLFLPLLLVVWAVCIILAVIMPRIWPLRQLPDTYLEEVGKQIDEDEMPANTSKFQWALSSACQRAEQTTASGIVKAGGINYLNAFMDLIPIILAWGTVGLMLVELTPIFGFISQPMGWFLSLFQISGAMDFAHVTLIGFIDMFLPALFLGGAPAETQFILAALSIVQVIYLAETGVLIIKSKIPLGIGKLFIIFMMRTLIALPLIVLFTRVFMNL